MMEKLTSNCTAENTKRKCLNLKNDVHLKFLLIINLQLLLIRLEQNPLRLYATNLENVGSMLACKHDLVSRRTYKRNLHVSFSSSQKSDKVKLELFQVCV